MIERKQTVTMRWRDVIFGEGQNDGDCPVALAIKLSLIHI